MRVLGHKFLVPANLLFAGMARSYIHAFLCKPELEGQPPIYDISIFFWLADIVIAAERSCE
jgi:hypothetical protein